MLPTLLINSGQSNGLGYKLTAADLPEHLKVPNGVTMILVGNVFQVMQPGANTGTEANPHVWNATVAWAHEWHAANPGQTLYVVNHVKGSTDIAADPDRLDWSPDSRGELWDQLAAKVEIAKGILGETTEHFLFNLGEEAAAHPHKAAAHEANLTDFFSELRFQFGDPDSSITLARLNSDVELIAEAAVQAAQDAVAAADPHTFIVNTDGFGLQADRLHWTGEAQAQFGREAYQAAHPAPEAIGGYDLTAIQAFFTQIWGDIL